MSNLKDIFKKELQLKGDKALLDARYMGIGHTTIVDAYKELGMDLPYKIIENNWLPRGISDHGWGNGYVRIAEGHKYHGKTYDDIDVQVHGGLTFGEHIVNNDNFSDGYWVGFDTAHHSDTRQRWPRHAVLDETIDLFNRIYGLS